MMTAANVESRSSARTQIRRFFMFDCSPMSNISASRFKWGAGHRWSLFGMLHHSLERHHIFQCLRCLYFSSYALSLFWELFAVLPHKAPPQGVNPTSCTHTCTLLRYLCNFIACESHVWQFCEVFRFELLAHISWCDSLLLVVSVDPVDQAWVLIPVGWSGTLWLTLIEFLTLHPVKASGVAAGHLMSGWGDLMARWSPELSDLVMFSGEAVCCFDT